MLVPYAASSFICQRATVIEPHYTEPQAVDSTTTGPSAASRCQPSRQQGQRIARAQVLRRCATERARGKVTRHLLTGSHVAWELHAFVKWWDHASSRQRGRGSTVIGVIRARGLCGWRRRADLSPQACAWPGSHAVLSRFVDPAAHRPALD